MGQIPRTTWTRQVLIRGRIKAAYTKSVKKEFTEKMIKQFLNKDQLAKVTIMLMVIAIISMEVIPLEYEINVTILLKKIQQWREFGVQTVRSQTMNYEEIPHSMRELERSNIQEWVQYNKQMFIKDKHETLSQPPQ